MAFQRRMGLFPGSITENHCFSLVLHIACVNGIRLSSPVTSRSACTLCGNGPGALYRTGGLMWTQVYMYAIPGPARARSIMRIGSRQCFAWPSMPWEGDPPQPDLPCNEAYAKVPPWLARHAMECKQTFRRAQSAMMAGPPPPLFLLLEW